MDRVEPELPGADPVSTYNLAQRRLEKPGSSHE